MKWTIEYRHVNGYKIKRRVEKAASAEEAKAKFFELHSPEWYVITAVYPTNL